MSQPPSESGNVVDPEVLASRRARRAEVSEDASLELRLFEAERRLGEAAAERDALRARVTVLERELRRSRQREWAEQQERLEAQGGLAASRSELEELRARLADAEAEFAATAAERDRARRALGDEGERREALEREGVLLRATAREAVVAARQALVGARASEDLEARIAMERVEFAERVEAVEQAVALVRDRLGAAARVLKERLETEGAARVAAQSRVAELETHARREAARRDAVEAELRATLESVRSGDAVRIAELTARVEAVVALAGGQDELRASLETMRARVAELQAGVAEELEVERAARWAAEAALDAERHRLAEAQSELTELRALVHRSAPDPSTLASLRDALETLRSTAPDQTTASPALSIDLSAAAARLRAATDLGETPASPTAEEPAAAPPAPAAAWRAAAAEPAPDDLAAAAPPEAAAEPAGPRRVRIPELRPAGRTRPWLRDSLIALATEEADIAELIVTGLLPLQAGLAGRWISYDLAVDGGLTQRVVVNDAVARVVERTGDADAGVSGPLKALVPLAAGGAGRRLPGARVHGRRHLRKLVKARRRPLGLEELAAAGVAPSSGLLLTLLARAVDPSWTTGRPLTVDVAPEGADRWRVVASGRGPLSILPAEGAPPAPATLQTSAGRLAAVLAGAGRPGDAFAEGDADAVLTLLGWFDRAQREPR